MLISNVSQSSSISFRKAKSKKNHPIYHYGFATKRMLYTCTRSSEYILLQRPPTCFIAKITPPLTQPATTSPPKCGAAKLDILRAPAKLGQDQRC